MTEHEAFLEWFNERENYSLRSDRFYEEAGHGMDLLPWLQAAFSMGARYEREECAKVAESYEPRCDTCPSGGANAIRARGNK